MRIVVIGGTGTAGVATIASLTKHGHEPIAVSRSGAGVGNARGFSADVVTGVGLEAALDGADAVIDCVGAEHVLDTRVFSLGSHNVAFAAMAAGVPRVVVLSAIAADESRFPFYQRKAEQERAYTTSALNVTIVRSTPFHEMLAEFFEAGSKFRLVPAILGAQVQPVASSDVAEVLVREATKPSGADIVNVGGPRVYRSRDLAKRWRAITGARGIVVNTPAPRALLEYVRSGMGLLPAGGETGTTSFESWLADRI